MNTTDCGTKFDLRSMPVLLNPEESSETASMFFFLILIFIFLKEEVKVKEEE